MKTTFFFAAFILTNIQGFAQTSPQSSSPNNARTAMSVSLSGLQGDFKANQVELTWKTMMEFNIDHYEIDRSSDGVNFQIIGTTPSKMTRSTSDYQLLYSYTDITPLSGISFYRISVISRDGFTKQSPVVQVFSNQMEGIKIYPTLIQNNMVFVETDKTLQGARLEFFDLSGKKISETSWESLSGRENVQVSRTSQLSAGTYIARLTSNGQPIRNQLMIVQNL